MKKKLLLLASTLCALTMGLTGCGSSNFDDNIEYMPVRESQRWGFLSREGEIVLADEYENEPSVVINDYFSIREGDGYSVYKMDKKKPTVVKGLEDLAEVGVFNEGLMPVCHKDEAIVVVDTDGKEKFRLDKYDGCVAFYSDGLLAVCVNEGEGWDQTSKWGFIDTKGNEVIKPRYEQASVFYNGKALVSDGDRKMVIDKQGNILFKLKEDENASGQFIGGRMAVKGDGYCGFYDEDGKFTKCPSKVKSISYYCADYYVFTNDNWDYGLMAYDGEELIRAKYDEMYVTPSGEIYAYADKKVSMLKKDGDVKWSLDGYRLGNLIKNFPIILKESSIYACFNSDGKEIKNSSFKAMGDDLCASGVILSSHKASKIEVPVVEAASVEEPDYGDSAYAVEEVAVDDYEY